MDPAPSPQSQPSDCWVGVLTLLPMSSRSLGPCLDPHPISCQLPSLPSNPGNALPLTGTSDSEYAPMSQGGRLLRPKSRPCEHRGEGQSQCPGHTFSCPKSLSGAVPATPLEPGNFPSSACFTPEAPSSLSGCHSISLVSVSCPKGPSSFP